MVKTIQTRDAIGRITSFIEVKDNGDKILKGLDYQVIGFYESAGNVTKDARYRVVGRGDVLMTLLNK